MQHNTSVVQLLHNKDTIIVQIWCNAMKIWQKALKSLGGDIISG
jgi:hypothetical protein